MGSDGGSGHALQGRGFSSHAAHDLYIDNIIHTQQSSTHPGLYSMTVERFSHDLDRSVMDRLNEESRPL